MKSIMEESEKKYIRYVQTSVTNFVYCGDKYLFLKRLPTKRVDPGRLNGVGGRLEIGEDFLTAAIRETKEETGYEVTASDIKLAVVVKLIGGYQEDWVSCYFKIKVNSLNIPIGTETEDGTLMWLDKDEVLDSKYNLVDDLHYVFNDIADGESTIFFTAQLNDKQKIISTSISKLEI